MKKRILAVIVTSIFIISLAGCGQTDQTPASPSTTPTATAQTSPSPEASASPQAAQTDEPQSTQQPEEAPTEEETVAAGSNQAATQPPANSSHNNGSSGSNAAQPPANNQTPPPAQTPTPPPAKEPSVQEIMDAMLAALPANNLEALPADFVEGVFNIDTSRFADVLVYGSMMSVKANEIILIKANDQAGVNEAVNVLNSRRDTLLKQWENYLQDQYQLVKDGTVTTDGLYAVLVIAEGGSSAVSAFHSALN